MPGTHSHTESHCMFLQKWSVPHLDRFVRDGTTKVPNFLNPVDGEGRERGAPAVSVNTNTHTIFADRLATTKAVLTLADEVEKTLWSNPSVTSRRAKSATNKTLLSNDTRFELLHEPYSVPLGELQHPQRACHKHLHHVISMSSHIYIPPFQPLALIIHWRACHVHFGVRHAMHVSPCNMAPYHTMPCHARVHIMPIQSPCSIPCIEWD